MRRLPPDSPTEPKRGEVLVYGFDVDQADRALIERAARRLRDQAISDGYAGLPHQHHAFAVALLLDELARHVRELSEDVRVQVVSSCRALTTKA